MSGSEYQIHVEQLKKGSYKAFTTLYETYAPRLYGFVFDTLKSRQQTAEVVQECFTRVWEKHATIDPTQSFKAYLFTIAKNLIIGEFRKQINRPDLVEFVDYINHDLLSENSTQLSIDLDEFLRSLAHAKKKLTPRQREIFELSREHGMSSIQIAKQLSISHQVVRNQLSAAMKTLRVELSDYLPLLLILLNW